MVKLDLENKIFIDKNGSKSPLVRRVLVPRSSGGYSPGWLIGFQDSYDENTLCQVLLEEPSGSPDMIKSKVVCYGDLLPIEEGLLT